MSCVNDLQICPSTGAVKSEIMSNKELADELHKLVVRKF